MSTPSSSNNGQREYNGEERLFPKDPKEPSLAALVTLNENGFRQIAHHQTQLMKAIETSSEKINSLERDVNKLRSSMEAERAKSKASRVHEPVRGLLVKGYLLRNSLEALVSSWIIVKVENRSSYSLQAFNLCGEFFLRRDFSSLVSADMLKMGETIELSDWNRAITAFLGQDVNGTVHSASVHSTAWQPVFVNQTLKTCGCINENRTIEVHDGALRCKARQFTEKSWLLFNHAIQSKPISEIYSLEYGYRID